MSLGIQGQPEQYSGAWSLKRMKRRNGKRGGGRGEIDKSSTKITTSSVIKCLPEIHRPGIWSIAPQNKISKCADNNVTEYSFPFIRTVNQTVKRASMLPYIASVRLLRVESRPSSSSVLEEHSAAELCPQFPQSPASTPPSLCVSVLLYKPC